MVIEASATNKYLKWKDKSKACLSRAVLRLHMNAESADEVLILTNILKFFQHGGKLKIQDSNGKNLLKGYTSRTPNRERVLKRRKDG